MLKIWLLGYPRFQLDNHEIDNRRFRNQRGVALLAFLAATQLAYSRDTLATILWPESANARHSLREVLSKIKSVIPDEYLDDQTHKVGLSTSAEIWVDVVEFRRLTAQIPSLVGQETGRRHEYINTLTTAIELYEEDFLNGFTLRGHNDFYYWQLEQSEQLREGYRFALKELIQCHMEHGEYATAIIQAQQLVALEPTSEIANHLLMQAFALEGQRTSALQQYKTYQQALDDEGLPLAEEVAQLYEDIQSNQFPPSGSRLTYSRMSDQKLTVNPQQRSDVRGDLRARVYDRVGVILEMPKRLIGRDNVLQEIVAACNANQHVLLVGLGGIGKTTLAAAAATEFISQKNGKVIWLQIGDAAPELVFEAIGRAMDWNEIMAASVLEDRCLALRERLLDLNVMLVLDNAWNGRALFEVMKAIPDTVPVIVTTRRPIPLDGQIISLNDLDDTSAVELLSYHAGKNYLENEDTFKLCHRLGYHPFNIEIAGKWLRMSPHFTPASLLNEIADAPHDLVIPGEFGEIGRESVKDLLDASTHVLASAERSTFVAMGMLSTPYASTRLFAHVLDQREEDVYKSLLNLQQQGLVDVIQQNQVHPRHFRIHDLTHSYVRTMSKEEGHVEDEIIAAVEQFVIESTQQQDYDLLEFDQVNILGAAQAAHRIHKEETFISIIKALVVDGYVTARGHSSILLELLEAAIQDARVSGARHRQTLHYLSSMLGNIYAYSIGDYDAGVHAYQDALAIARELKNTHREALLLSIIGTVRAFQGQADARTYLEEARDLALRTNDDPALSQILEHIGHYELSSHNEEAARQTFAASLEVAERLRDTTRIFYALINLAASEKDFGNTNAALELNTRAYEVARESDNHVWMAFALENLGEVRDSLQQRQLAQQYFNEALELYYQSGAAANINRLVNAMQAAEYEVNILDDLLDDLKEGGFS